MMITISYSLQDNKNTNHYILQFDLHTLVKQDIRNPLRCLLDLVKFTFLNLKLQITNHMPLCVIFYLELK